MVQIITYVPGGGLAALLTRPQSAREGKTKTKT